MPRSSHISPSAVNAPRGGDVGRRENGPFNGPFSLLRVGAAADWCLDSLLSASRAFWHYDYPRQELRRLQGVLGAAGWDAPRVAAGWVDARTPRSSERGVLVGGDRKSVV